MILIELTINMIKIIANMFLSKIEIQSNIEANLSLILYEFKFDGVLI